MSEIEIDERIGFDCSQVLLKCNSTAELDEAMRVVNNIYRIYRDRLVVLECMKLNRVLEVLE